MKYICWVIFPFLLLACSKSSDSGGEGAPAPQSKVQIDKNERPALYRFLYENACDNEKKATYWFGYEIVKVNQPGSGGFRVVLAVQPRGKVISLAYRISSDFDGLAQGMTLAHNVFSLKDFAVSNSGINLGSEGFFISEQGDEIVLTTTRDILPVHGVQTFRLVKDTRTDDEILHFIGMMDLYSNQFSLACGH